jgi:deoxycytidine triphosphate deaminase
MDEVNGMKVMVDHEIETAIARGELVLNADPEGCRGACYELRMGDVYYDLTEDEKRFTVKPGETVLIKPGHRVILITHEKLALNNQTFARVVSKGSLFSMGLSAVATYADPGFHGRLGIVTQNISDKYIELPLLEQIAKVDFTILETPAKRPYHGQHGFETKTWPFQHQFQKTREQLAGDPRLGTPAPAPVELRTETQSSESLANLVSRQIDADRKHGFPVDPPDEEARGNQLSKDLVGLMGEIGEFANLLKKVELTITRPGYDGPNLAAATPDLRLELADAQIYLLRLAHLLRVDLGEAVLEKMRLNDVRYGYLKNA